MQILYGADASNINLTAQKRLLRVVEGQTQATPYAGYLDPSLRNLDGSVRVPAEADTKVGDAAGQGVIPLKRSANAYTYQGSLTPGLCLVKTTGENLAVHNGAKEVKTFGLLGQWVGGTFDGVKTQNEISAWLGPDSVYDLLAPGFNETGISGKPNLAEAVSSSTAGVPVYLYATADGRLGHAGALGKTQAEAESEKYVPVAEVVDRPSAGVLRIKLLV